MTPKQANWLHILSAGVVGGFIAWLIAATFPGYLTQVSSMPLDVGRNLLGGGLAGMAGVYIVANTDTSHFPKAVTFAALCGLSWSTVIEAASSVAKIAGDRNAVANVAQANKEAQEKLESGTVTPADVQAAAAATTVAAERVDTIATPAVRERAIDMTRFNIERLGNIRFSNAAPEVKAAANQSLESLMELDIAPELLKATQSVFAAGSLPEGRNNEF